MQVHLHCVQVRCHLRDLDRIKSTKRMAGMASSLVTLKNIPKLLAQFIRTIIGGKRASLGNDLLSSVWTLDKFEARGRPPLLHFFNLLYVYELSFSFYT